MKQASVSSTVHGGGKRRAERDGQGLGSLVSRYALSSTSSPIYRVPSSIVSRFPRWRSSSSCADQRAVIDIDILKERSIAEEPRLKSIIKNFTAFWHSAR